MPSCVTAEWPTPKPPKLKIATWNVNSLKVRLTQLCDWANRLKPDVIALQETKSEDASFPRQALEDLGYAVAFSGQKTYNGVALLSKAPLLEIACGIPRFEDPQKRVIAATIEGVRVISVYVPNGQSVDSDKYQYKLRWLEALQSYLKDSLSDYPKLIVLGDFNIAPEDRDVHDPSAWLGAVLVSPEERAAFQGLLDLGLKDSIRLHHLERGPFTWWDYRMNGFKRNLGLRIDHILISQALVPTCLSTEVDLEPRRLERPSDHTPVLATLTLPASAPNHA